MFKVGDLVVSMSDSYSITNKYMICKVTKLLLPTFMHVKLVDSIYKNGLRYSHRGNHIEKLDDNGWYEVRLDKFSIFRQKKSHYPSWF